MKARLGLAHDWYRAGDAYLEAAKRIKKSSPRGVYVGDLPEQEKFIRLYPLTQTLGLAVETTFKGMIYLKSDKYEPPKIHNLEKLYELLQDHWLIDDIEKHALSAAEQIGPPPDMLERMESLGQRPEDWFNFKTQLKALNHNYYIFESNTGEESDDKFRSRYPSRERAYKEVCVEAIFLAVNTALIMFADALNNRRAQS